MALKQTVGRRLSQSGAARVTVEDPLESAFAEHRIPVKEEPFWTRHGSPLSDLGSDVRAPLRSPPAPMLVTTIDAEEDFDWNGPFIRTSTRVTSMRSQYKAHRVFERHGVVPTYLVDFPVASQDFGRGPLKELLQSGQCEIGTQLHPWVNPPFVEVISNRNSYPGNLPMVIEYDKLLALTNMLEEAFGLRPRIYRAGRYGFGPNTAEILNHLGYLVDTSMMPCWNYGPRGGPDFRTVPAEPHWIGHDRTLLEMPVSVAFAGRAARFGARVSDTLYNRISEAVGLTSIVARLGLIERIRLTPEGVAINEGKRLVRQMIADGKRVFVLTYHSPSLEPGGTPYVRTADDLARFLAWLEEFYDFFAKEIGGRCVSWRDVRDAMLSDGAQAGVTEPAPAA